MIMGGRILLAVCAACAAVLGSTVDLRSQTTPPERRMARYAGTRVHEYSRSIRLTPPTSPTSIAWRRSAVADELRAEQPDLRFGNSFRSTPLMVDGVLFAQNGIGLVEAFDPETGKTVWVQERFEGDQLRGQPSRGVAYWGAGPPGGDAARLLTVRGQYLIALEPKSGKIIRSFGRNGRVDLVPALGPKATGFAMTSSPQVCNDVVIIGNAMSDSPNRKDSLAPGIVQAIDVRTGRPRWTFSPNPAARANRQRDLGRGLVVIQRRRQRVVADQFGRAARSRVSTDWRTDQRHVRRSPPGGQPVLEQPGVRPLRHRRARLALPAGASRLVGLRLQRRADPRGYPLERQGRQGRRAALKQAWPTSSIAPRAGHLADRAACPEVEYAG
jgi:hypothetical protein